MIKELRNKSDIEIADLITKLKTQLLEIRFNHANGESSSLNKIKEIKKTIAQSLTILSQRNVKLSFTTYETRIIKTDEKGQIFIPVKSSKKLEINKKANEPIKKEKNKFFSKPLVEKIKPNQSEAKAKKIKPSSKSTIRVQSKMSSKKG